MKYFDFYYGDESEQYSFYTVPKMFFDNDKFKDLSPMSKLLYSFLLDRMSLSKKRNWIDDKNRAYIKYSLKAICNDSCVSKYSVINSFCKYDSVTIFIVEKKLGFLQAFSLFLSCCQLYDLSL